ncbi:hypothetical protein YDYSY3_36790 [Paenibacillus chitinolyticus]|uniref:hypothetical protein n=1 Tax=Paenibacillus chitinolyticus TaxID=79263 RepID=UPI0026E4E466|nr:hypothetical protein [Paenibacillus chitinolyticus]GKS12679.1 hypothetical protein YDYSY3_36790 [Paenibacillus chitinolyticus]
MDDERGHEGRQGGCREAAFLPFKGQTAANRRCSVLCQVEELTGAIAHGPLTGIQMEEIGEILNSLQIQD